jgi:hypothetical protein
MRGNAEMVMVDHEPEPDENQHPRPADWLTIPGRLLLIFTIIAFGVGVYFFYMSGGPPFFKAGEEYPIIFWIGPVAIAALIFFMLAAFTLQLLGIRIFQKKHL